MEVEIIHVFDSFKLSSGRIIAFLKSRDGKLAIGSILVDDEGKEWKIDQWVLTTASVEGYEKISKLEAENIFQYSLIAVNNDQKPSVNTSLIVNNSA